MLEVLFLNRHLVLLLLQVSDLTKHRTRCFSHSEHSQTIQFRLRWK
uniref:Uncharacterized protein n=1 Tax=Myoviridae sp. ctCo31 TaxID=2825053 RepID=A0A8S5ULZ8_9CAUD|nr:MAG TPA: hypothetical protein [Myoviridae sp. ctCo31]